MICLTRKQSPNPLFQKASEQLTEGKSPAPRRHRTKTAVQGPQDPQKGVNVTWAARGPLARICI